MGDKWLEYLEAMDEVMSTQCHLPQGVQDMLNIVVSTSIQGRSHGTYSEGLEEAQFLHVVNFFPKYKKDILELMHYSRLKYNDIFGQQ